MIEKNRIFIYLLVIFFAVFVGTGLFLSVNNNKVASKQSANQTSTEVATIKQVDMVIPTTAPTQGSLTLLPTSKDSRFQLKDNVTFNLNASSSGKNIVGYDVVLYYDPLSFDLVSADSTIPDFKVYSYKRGNYLTLTAVKSLQNNSQSVFDKTNIATLVFKPKKAGKYNFSLRQSSEGNEKTDIITDKTEVLNPTLMDTSVEVY